MGLTVKLREIGLQCSLTLLLGNPTVESIATRGDWISTGTSHSQRFKDDNIFRTLGNDILDQNHLRISTDTVEKILPCLPMQESTITSTLNSRDLMSYINNIVFELKRDVDLHRFKWAWLDLIKDTSILRTIFYHHQDSFAQLVLRPQTVLPPWTETTTERESSARHLLSDLIEDINHDISNNIQERPALRLHLVRTTSGHHMFSVTIHHALYDGQSFDMMMEDLWLRYRNQGVPHRTAFEKLLEYHVAQDTAIARIFLDPVPGEKPSNARISDNARRRETRLQHLSIGRCKLEAFEDSPHVANKSEVTLATLCQCLFAIILARKMKRSDILFGSVLSGRSVSVKGAESIMAPCITTIPQRIQIQSDDNLSQFVRRVQSTSAHCLE